MFISYEYDYYRFTPARFVLIIALYLVFIIGSLLQPTHPPLEYSVRINCKTLFELTFFWGEWVLKICFIMMSSCVCFSSYQLSVVFFFVFVCEFLCVCVCE